MVTSSTPKEGKTTFSSSFAVMAAKSGSKVLIIDCDMRRPSIAKALNHDTKHDLCDLLTGSSTLQQVLNHDKKLGIDYITSHPNTPNSQELLGSNSMKSFLEKMRSKYDLIVLDTPPIMAVSDCLVLSKIADTTVFVVRWDKTPRQLVKESLKQIKFCDIKLAGVVLSRVDIDKHNEYGYNDSAYYYGNYKEYYNG